MILLNNSEFSEYYSYFITQNKNFNLLVNLKNEMVATIQFFKNLPADKLEYQYEIGKWTPKDILQHLIDTERIFTYRALRFSRLDSENLSGYNENDYAKFANANARPFLDLLAEYESVRTATMYMYKSFTEEMLLNVGTANDSVFSVRAIAFIVTGHEKHHINTIKERYLK